MITNSSSTNYMNNQLLQNQQNLLNAMIQLSSGKQINSAADNPAAMAILAGFQSQSGGLAQANQNLSMGSSLLQTENTASQSETSIANQIQNLSIQADNGTLNAQDEQSIQQQVNQLTAQMNAIAQTTNFNGVQTNNQTNGVTLHASNAATDTMTAPTVNETTSALGMTGLTMTGGAESAILASQNAIGQLSTDQSNIGAMQNRLQDTVQNNANAWVQTESSTAQMQDANIATQMSREVQSSILMQTGIAVMTMQNTNAASFTKLLL